MEIEIPACVHRWFDCNRREGGCGHWAAMGENGLREKLLAGELQSFQPLNDIALVSNHLRLPNDSKGH
jgi:hypothetical protein